MSAFRRIILGMAGNWVGIGLTFAQRLVITPLVLSVWSAHDYGLYIAISAAISLLTLPGRSYENVINREFLRIGGDEPERLRALHGGGVLVALALEGVVATTAYLLLRLGGLLDADTARLMAGYEWAIALSMFLARAFNGFPMATFAQVLSCYGYFPKVIWLGLVGRALAVVVPGAGAYAGFSPIGVTVLDLLAPCLFTLPAWVFLRRWALRAGVWGWAPEIRRARQVLLLSVQNFLIEGVGMMRGEGLRLILSSLAGTVALAAFSAMRTGANLALQGLTTLTVPIAPELMRYLRTSDQDRMEATLSVIWFPVVFAMGPALLALQWVISPLFAAWTRGKVEFDPLLFALLSSSVLFTALQQPAVAIVAGNNLLRVQLLISTATSAIVILVMFVTVPIVGIVGTAGALLTGEVLAAAFYVLAARRWLQAQFLRWPKSTFSYSLIVAIATSVALTTVAWANNRLHGHAGALTKAAAVAAALAVQTICGIGFWSHLPSIARRRLREVFLSRIARRS